MRAAQMPPEQKWPNVGMALWHLVGPAKGVAGAAEQAEAQCHV